MIESLLLVNFKCHTKRLIEFSPQVTCIVGPTDAGKSAILQALRLVCLNKPSGDHFIKTDTESMRLLLKVDGHRIRRIKGKENTYFLDEEKYKAFGTGVPDPVARLLNVDEDNFQTQHAPSFWFFNSPGEVSRELNRIINLDLIDRVLANVASKQRANRSEIDIVQKRLDQARNRAESLSWVESANEQLCTIEQLEERLRVKRTTIASVRSALEERHTLSLRLSECVRAKDRRSRIEADIHAYEQVHKRAERLRELLEERTLLCHQLSTGEASRKEWARKLAEAKTSTCPTCGQELPPS